VSALNVNHSTIQSGNDRTLVFQRHAGDGSGTAGYGIQPQSHNLERSAQQIAFQSGPPRLDLSVCNGFKPGFATVV